MHDDEAVVMHCVCGAPRFLHEGTSTRSPSKYRPNKCQNYRPVAPLWFEVNEGLAKPS